MKNEPANVIPPGPGPKCPKCGSDLLFAAMGKPIVFCNGPEGSGCNYSIVTLPDNTVRSFAQFFPVAAPSAASHNTLYEKVITFLESCRDKCNAECGMYMTANHFDTLLESLKLAAAAPVAPLDQVAEQIVALAYKAFDEAMHEDSPYPPVFDFRVADVIESLRRGEGEQIKTPMPLQKVAEGRIESAEEYRIRKSKAAGRGTKEKAYCSTVTEAWLDELTDLLGNATECSLCDGRPCLICFDCKKVFCEAHHTCNCRGLPERTEKI